MITRKQVVQLAQSCGFTTGEYNAGDGTGRKVPFVAFDGINMLAALENFATLVAEPKEAIMTNRDKILEVRIIDGSLVIKIGVDMLCHAVSMSPNYNLDKIKIIDNDGFALAIAAELELEEEDGSTPVHRIFDSAANAAIENGSDSVEIPDEGAAE